MRGKNISGKDETARTRRFFYSLTVFLLPMFCLLTIFFHFARVGKNIDILTGNMFELLIINLTISGILGGLLVISSDKLRILIIGGIVVVFLDLALGGRSLLNIFNFLDPMYRIPLKVFSILVAVLLVFLLLWLIRQHVSIIVGAILATAFTTSVLWLGIEAADNYFDISNTSAISKAPYIPAERKRGKSELPIILHFVFDGHLAPAGIPLHVPGGIETKQRIADFYARFGFRLYTRAYSRFAWTDRSMPAAFDFDYRTVSNETMFNKGSLVKNAYFDKLEHAGYQISVNQIFSVNYCSPRYVVSCNTLQSTPVQYLPNGWLELFYTMLSTYDDSISMAIADSVISLVKPNMVERKWDHYFLLGFPGFFDRVTEQILHADNGEMIFSHFFPPHDPFVLSKDCQYVRGDSVFKVTGTLEQAWDDSYQRYFEQINCVYKVLERLFEYMEGIERFDNAIVIIHGDHGARITRRGVPDGEKMDLTEQELVDRFSTLFAIRSPSIAPGRVDRLVSLQKLFAEFFDPKGATTNKPKENASVTYNSVVVTTRTTGLAHDIEVQMPDF